MAKCMKVDMGFPPEFPQGKLAAMQERLDKLWHMSKKQLVVYAEKEFKLYLGGQICNGKLYLFKKVAYYEQKRMLGLTEKAVKRLANLDEPETIKAFQEEERIKQEAAMATKKSTTKKDTAKAKKTPAKKSTALGKDEDGFRVGSKGSAMFALLKKGCTKAALDKVGDKAVGGFLAGIPRKREDWSAGRSAIISKDGDKLQVTSYVDLSGKTVKVPVPKKRVRKSTAKPKGAGKKAGARA